MLRRLPPGLLAIPLACSVAFACSGNSSTTSTVGISAGTSPFNGSWTCTDTGTYTVTSPAGAGPYVRTATGSTEIDISSGGTLTFTTAAGDGGVGCASSWTTSGDGATLVPGGSCSGSFTSEGYAVSYDAPYTTGTGSVNGDMMTFQLDATFTGKAVSGAVTITLSGTYSGTSSCTK